ncbi:flagellar hook capping FlgD N-terminal domain-containing protein [Phenylobacterium sp.]|uniref:flagellar hook capping FlgD N-terminal domain-containing protein n=1 Tax=Phenylobacterium sp. TaxID=1871053 RepID=UPI0035AE6465
MTDTSAVSSTTASTVSTSSAVTQSFDSTEFLGLLMTQLQNQNPLDPTDPSEFTSQIVSYASLEQQLNTNSYLSSMTDTMSSMSDNLASVLTQVSLLASGDDSSSTTTA